MTGYTFQAGQNQGDLESACSAMAERQHGHALRGRVNQGGPNVTHTRNVGLASSSVFRQEKKEEIAQPQHSLVIGMTGSGKSAWIQEILVTQMVRYGNTLENQI